MSAEIGRLALKLVAPMQSWGFESRFQRRTTGLHPTKSGVIGLICAAMGLAKRFDEEDETLRKLADLKMTSIAIPRQQTNHWKGTSAKLPVRRLEDYHTVGGGYDKKTQRQFKPRKASGDDPCEDATVTHRQYLLDACFGVILSGDHSLLKKVSVALQDPVWGIWFGRKSCIPAEPIYRGLFDTELKAQRALIGDAPLESFTTVTETASFADGTSINDKPVSFGDGTSSGPDKRQFDSRRIVVTYGTRDS